MKLDIDKVVGSIQKKTKSGSAIDNLKDKAENSSSILGKLKKDKMEAAKNKERKDLEKKNEELRKNLTADQILLTDITDGKLPRSKINHVIDKYPDAHFPKEIRGMIPQTNPKFRWNPNDLEAMILGKKTGHRVLLTGPPGTGKTSTSEQFAAIINQPHFQFNGKEGVEYSSFLGQTGAKNGATVWYDGVFTMAAKFGAACCIDEVMKIPAGVQMALQTAYQRGGFLILDDKEGSYDDKKIIPKPEFMLTLTDNVKGGGENLDKYAATTIQDSSFLDRIGITRNTTYLPREVEVKMLIDDHGIGSKEANELVQLANLIRNGFDKGTISLTLSPRGLEAICEFMNSGIDLDTSLDLAFINKLPDDRDIQEVKGYLTTVGIK